MVNPLRMDPWGYRLGFLGLAVVILFLRLLPLGREAGSLPGPDILLCLMLAWVMRRPDFLPLWLIIGITLAEDLILMRPPGLWTALVVLATEFLRSRIALTRELSFVIEWLVASGLMVGMLILYRLAFALALVPQQPFGFAVVQVIWSILAYPAVILLSRHLLDTRKPGTGEVDDFGRRL